LNDFDCGNFLALMFDDAFHQFGRNAAAPKESGDSGLEPECVPNPDGEQVR
jgi:hypothetical protein